MMKTLKNSITKLIETTDKIILILETKTFQKKNKISMPVFKKKRKSISS